MTAERVEIVQGVTTVVRGFGYDVTHVVTVPRGSLVNAAWPSEQYPFVGIRTPVVARCGKRVRSVQDVVVVMQAGTKVKCRECVRWTGITEQGPAIRDSASSGAALGAATPDRKDETR